MTSSWVHPCLFPCKRSVSTSSLPAPQCRLLPRPLLSTLLRLLCRPLRLALQSTDRLLVHLPPLPSHPAAGSQVKSIPRSLAFRVLQTPRPGCRGLPLFDPIFQPHPTSSQFWETLPGSTSGPRAQSVMPPAMAVLPPPQLSRKRLQSSKATSTHASRSNDVLGLPCTLLLATSSR